jgi:pimeloyl-ACP methyl ester carboxylesterase
MKTIVLIHGAWHGAWCWDRLIPYLDGNNTRILAPELQWHESPGQSLSDNGIPAYILDLCSTIKELGCRVVLAGHSFGGMVISQLAELLPDRIEALIYISGFLLENGQCINDTEPLMSGSLAQADMKLTRDKNTVYIPGHALRGALYGDCTEDDYRFAAGRIRPQPLSTFQTRVNITVNRFGSIPLHYIECTRDRAIPASAQRMMYSRWDCASIHSLDSAHSPFFSMARDLAAILLHLS